LDETPGVAKRGEHDPYAQFAKSLLGFSDL